VQLIDQWFERRTALERSVFEKVRTIVAHQMSIMYSIQTCSDCCFRSKNATAQWRSNGAAMHASAST